MNVIREVSPKHKTIPFHLPCLATPGTKIFAPTADQRFLAGKDGFLRTHFPIQLQSHSAIGVKTITEQNILQTLLEPAPTIVGNRVIVLYGAAGSGKSELLRWLQTQIHQQDKNRAEVTMRISRTDLDIFHIAQRFHHLDDMQSFQMVTQQRWEECRRKPRTLAKILVLTALEQLLRDDDQINALYYQLIDVVQTNLEHCFSAMSQPTDDIGSSVELFSREDLVNILQNSVVSVTLEYETLRFYILKAFRDQLLEGLDLPRTLKQIAQQIQEKQGQRPILLIDDLVQSINLFATDLLDYFITLEEGCWDVVIGITPNSLESTARGKELLSRIAYLDTIDDRVQKFWLSDEYGFSSSFLNESNCAEYARLYLSEYKHQNQQSCSASCPSFQRCRLLESDRETNLLSPFNKELLVRLFRSLPNGKGKVRYFTLYLREILEQVTQGEDLLTVLQQYVKAEQAVYHTDKRLVQVLELYSPFIAEEKTEGTSINVPHLYQFFDIQEIPDVTRLPLVATLYKRHRVEQKGSSQQEISRAIDPGKEAIKAWLQGEIVNKQQLRNLRRGIIKAIKEGYLLDLMTRLHIAKTTRTLRWTQTHYDTIPPVQLEDIDDFAGVIIKRTIGTLAYLLYDFADAMGPLEQDIRQQILSHHAFPSAIFEAISYRERIHDALERQLGMTVEQFAFSLLLVTMKLGYYPVELPLISQQKVGNKTSSPPLYPESIEGERPRLTNAQISMVRRLFDDCFKLRENVYDGFLLENLSETISPEQALERLQTIEAVGIEDDFRLNEEPLRIVVDEIQAQIAKLEKLKTNYQIKRVLVSICRAGIGTDDASLQLINLLGNSNETESLLDNFLGHCHVYNLHRALCLGYLIDEVQYEQSLLHLRHILTVVDSESVQEQQQNKPSSLSRNFTKDEVGILIHFTQHGFRMPLNQLQPSFLGKVASHLPDVYKQLEIRLQRG